MEVNTFEIFQYLENLKIKLDKDEFDYQYSCHPDFPSLLAVSDTLNFFNIKNGALKADKTQIKFLPNTFVSVLNDKGEFLSYIEKKGDNFQYTSESLKKITVNSEKFIEIWGNIVFLIEAEESPILKENDNSKKIIISTTLFSLSALIILFLSKSDFLFTAFFLFSTIGLLLSIASLKNLFGAKIEFINKLCNISTTSSCDSIINSSKWKIFKKISFSDLSITFFTSQLLGLFLIRISDYYNSYFPIQTIILSISIPIIFLSLYYQKFVEKKWCPLCLSIIGVIFLEIGCLVVFSKFSIINFSQIVGISYVLGALFLLTTWFLIKNFLNTYNQIKKSKAEATRFKRNYKIFKNSLLAEKVYDLPQNLISIGEQNAPLELCIITSPLCGFCKDPHYILKSLYKKHKKSIKLSIIYFASKDNENLFKMCMVLSNLIKQDEDQYFDAMDKWYENKDIEKWLEIYDKFSTQMEKNIENQHDWCNSNKLNFTPCLFINGRKYPNVYDLEDIPFYIDELLDDKTIIKLQADTEKPLKRVGTI